MTTTNTITAELINYFDVWGNPKDGFEVNNLCREGEVELPENFTDHDVLKALKAKGFLKPHVRLNMLLIEDLWPFVEISQRNNGCPICRLEFNED